MSKSPSLRRIQADIRELALDPSDQYHASPLENDMFEWHFTIRGAKGTDFEGGVYHGRILLPPEYPFKPPHIMFLTPSGRFETNTKVCLSFSAYHPELWQPAWGIRLILEALISFLETPADGAIGALDWSSGERKRLAKQSTDWCCPTCGKISALIPVKAKKCEESSGESPRQTKPSRFAREIQALKILQMQQHKNDNEDKGDGQENQPKPADEETKEGEESNNKVVASDLVTEALEEDRQESESASMEAAATTGSGSKKDEEVPDIPGTAVSDEDDNSILAPATELEQHGEHAVAVVHSSKWIGVIDPMMQLIIVILSAICFILLRKIQAICADLQALDNE